MTQNLFAVMLMPKNKQAKRKFLVKKQEEKYDMDFSMKLLEKTEKFLQHIMQMTMPKQCLWGFFVAQVLTVFVESVIKTDKL